MIKKIRILGIAPYKGLATLMKQCALQYPEIEFTAYAGSMEQGLALAVPHPPEVLAQLFERLELLRKLGTDGYRMPVGLVRVACLKSHNYSLLARREATGPLMGPQCL